jgi:hypothetical protein
MGLSRNSRELHQYNYYFPFIFFSRWAHQRECWKMVQLLKHPSWYFIPISVGRVPGWNPILKLVYIVGTWGDINLILSLSPWEIIFSITKDSNIFLHGSIHILRNKGNAMPDLRIILWKWSSKCFLIMFGKDMNKIEHLKCTNKEGRSCLKQWKNLECLQNEVRHHPYNKA